MPPIRNAPPQNQSAAGQDVRSLAWAGMHTEVERLKQVIAGEQQLIEELARVPDSPEAAGSLAEAHWRLERALLERCADLEQLLGSALNCVLVLEKENAELRQSVQGLQYRLDCAQYQLRQALGVKTATAPASASDRHDGPEQPSGPQTPTPPRKRGAPTGHRGNTRAIPDRVHAEQVIPPPDTCTCGGHSVAPLTEFDTKYTEDIPPVNKIVTRRIYLRGRCQQCGKIIRHPDAVTGPPVQIGPNLSVHFAVMNQLGTTFRKLSLFSTDVLGIGISPAGVLGIVDRVADSLVGSYYEIREALRLQQVLNGDETGWKIFGQRCYIWCFCNRTLAFFHADYSRAAAVIEEILGKDFPGIVICDFYAAYNFLPHTQRCLVHLLRDIKEEREILKDSKLLEHFEAAVRQFIEDGLRLQAAPDGPFKDQQIAELEKRLDRLAKMPVTKGKAETLTQRIEKYRDDLIRFVTHPAVEFHNNRAERQLRPMVLARKVSFGSNTGRGAFRHCVLNTIVESCRLQGIDPVEFIHRAYTSGGLDPLPLTGTGPP